MFPHVFSSNVFSPASYFISSIFFLNVKILFIDRCSVKQKICKIFNLDLCVFWGKIKRAIFLVSTQVVFNDPSNKVSSCTLKQQLYLSMFLC